MADFDRPGRLTRRNFLAVSALGGAAALAGDRAGAAVVTLPARSSDSFLDSVGVNTHFSNRSSPYRTAFAQVANLIGDLGIRHVRDEAVYLDGMQRTHPHYVCLRDLAARGIRLSMVCHDPLNRWVVTPPQIVPTIIDWCDGAVAIVEGGNEPPLAADPLKNPAISARHQRDVWTAVRAQTRFSSIRIAAPSYIQDSVPLAENLGDACNLGNLHPYPGALSPENDNPAPLTGFQAGFDRIAPGKPVISSETGYHTAMNSTSTHKPVPPAVKARYTPRLLLWGYLKGVRRTYLYELVSSNANGDTDKESFFGLYGNDLVPTPAAGAVKSLLALFRPPFRRLGAGSVEIPSFECDHPNVQVLAFRRPGGSAVIVAWLAVPCWRAGDPLEPAVQTARATLHFRAPPPVMVRHRITDAGTTDRLRLRAATTESRKVSVEISDQVSVVELI